MTYSISYRYASTLGIRYCLPIYFRHIDAARSYKAQCDKLLTGLPGQDSMRIEKLVDGEWVELQP